MRNWIRGNLFLILALFFQRLFFYLQFGPQFQGAPLSEVFWALLVGLRFDLMVIGYCNVPVVFFLTTSRVQDYLRAYFLWLSLLLVVVGIMDHAYFSETGDRLNQYFQWPDLMNVLISAPAAINVLPFLIYFYFKRERVKSSFTWKKNLVAIFIAALSMRGTLGQHHLDLRHAEISTNPKINILAINSAYAFDQALRKRR